MNSIKAFLKAKGLYLVCLALVFAATITGIAAIRSVVRGVEDLTRVQKQALEEGTDVWDSPDAAVNQPAQDVPVATAQPSPAPSAAVCIVILAAGGWAVWQRLRRDWQLCCFVRAAGNLAARWLER